MFYIVFFVTNYFTLGLGVWLAMRHGEILRMEPAMVSEAKLTASDVVEKGIDKEETATGPQETQFETEDDSPVVIAESLPDAVPETMLTEVGESEKNDATAPEKAGSSPEPAPQEKSPLLSLEMIEQVIGMADDMPADDLQGVISQLQEIHGVMANADNRCYVSEDAESFVTPDEEKYATTAICRPVVGRRKR